MYTMKQVCAQTGMTYENLKFYCNQGLVPGVMRDRNNCRIFDDHDVAWIRSLVCLKKCGMTIAEMKQYLALCLQGQGSIPERRKMLAEKRQALETQLKQIQDSMEYIDWKLRFYQDVLEGRTEYFSNLTGKKRDRTEEPKPAD